MSVRDVESHADNSLGILRVPLGLVSRIGKLPYVVDGMDTGVVRTDVSRQAPSRQELEEREECRHLSKVRVMYITVTNGTHVALDQVRDSPACQTTNEAPCTDPHKNDHPLQVSSR